MALGFGGGGVVELRGALLLPGDRSMPPRVGVASDGEQDQRHDHREEIRDPMRSLHGRRRSRNRSGATTGCPGGTGGGGTDGGGGAAMYGCDSCGGGHLGSTLDMRQRSEIAVQVPREECGGNPASLPCHLISHLARVTPAALEQRTQQGQSLGSGPCGSRGTAAFADGPAQGGRECSMRSCETTARAIEEGWRVAGHAQGP